MRYITKQAKLVFDFLKENPHEHFTAEQVHAALISQGHQIGRTTVYRQLDRLYDEYRVRRFSSGDSDPHCYQFESDDCHNHYHLKCSTCGRLIHTESNLLDRIAQHIFQEHNFTIDESRTVLYGTCCDCRKESTI